MLTGFTDEIRRNPDADFTSEIKALAAEFRRMEATSIKNFVKTLLLNLYGLGNAEPDARQLKCDIAKVAVFGGKAASSAERVALLRCFYDAIAVLVKDVFPEIIEICDEIADACADKG